MSRLAVNFLLALLLFIGVTACGNTETQSSESTMDPKKEAQKEQILLNFGTTSPSSGQYPFWVAVTNGINKYSEEHLNNQLKVTLIETEGTEDNLNRLMKDEIQLASSITSTDYQLFNGVESFIGKGWKDLRTLFAYNASVYVPVVRADSGVDSLEDLNGKRFSPGATGSSGAVLAKTAFDNLGIQPEYYQGGAEDAFQAIKDNEIVGIVKSANTVTTMDSGIKELSVTTEIKPLTWTPEQIDILKSKFPYYQYVSIPAGIYPNQDKEIMAQGVIIDVTTSKNLSEEAAYNILKGVWENKQLQVNVFPSLVDNDYGKLTMESAHAPLHPGAVKFYKEMGYTIPEKLLPPESK